MPASAQIYANALKFAWQGQIDLGSDTLKMGLLDSGYTPDLFSDTHWSDVNSHEIAGTGYTAGGVTLTSQSLTLTAANSWGASWAADTVYDYGQIVRPATGNGFLYRQVNPAGGTSGGSSPTFPTTEGDTVTDSSAVWACLGDAALVFTADTVQWATATFSASYAVIYDAQTATPSAEPLLVLNTFAAVQSPSAQTFQVIPDPNAGFMVFSPPS